MQQWSRLTSALGSGCVLALFCAGPAQSAETVRVSVNSAGMVTMQPSADAAISGDGRYIVFHSRGALILPDEDSGDYPDDDVFLRDVSDGTLTRISVNSAGVEQPGESWGASVADDGVHVAFTSSARLASGDSTVYRDVFVRNRDTLRTVLVSKSYMGTAANRDSQNAVISPNSYRVAYASRASNLVEGDTNDYWDVFLKYTGSSVSVMASVNSEGEQSNGNSSVYDSPALSEDGLIVAFTSFANNLAAGDDNAQPDVFVRDVLDRTTTLISCSNAGDPGNGESGTPSISYDGRYVAFRSTASNLVPDDTNGVSDVFVRDRQTGQTERVSINLTGEQGNNHSFDPSVSSTGRFIAFHTLADNLVDDDANDALDVVVHDRETGVTRLVSTNQAGEVANGHSEFPAISAGGRYIAYQSRATDLIADDRNLAQDIFRHEMAGDRSSSAVKIIPVLNFLLTD